MNELPDVSTFSDYSAHAGKTAEQFDVFDQCGTESGRCIRTVLGDVPDDLSEIV